MLFCCTPDLRADTVTAAWDKNSETDIAGYILSYGIQSGTYSTIIDVGNVTTKQLTLRPGRYYFVVQAYNTSALVSARSVEISFYVGIVPTGPSVTSLSPTSGSVGTAVTINGANFGATQGTSTVRFNGSVATPRSWSATRIVASVPSGATTGVVTVTVAGMVSTGVSFAVATGLRSPWRATAIGSPAVGGSATYASGTFTITGAGADIGGTADEFQFVYQTLQGDGEIVARVATLQHTSSWAKAGVMIRETLTATSRNAFAAFTPGNGLAFQRRVTTAGSTAIASSGTVTAPYRVRLVRRGSTFSAYQSSTGTSWSLMGSQTISMASTVYVGLAVTSHNISTRATATFTNATVFDATTRFTTTSMTSSPFRMTSEDSTSGALATSAITDTKVRASEGTSTVSTPRVKSPIDSDYDGDGKADVTVVTPSTGMWSIRASRTGTALTATLGAMGDMPVPGDYDGDGRADIAMYRPATGEWSVLLSSTEYVAGFAVSWGSNGDTPVPGDYDGDAATDIAVYHSATGQWQILKSSTKYTTSIVTIWGASGDVPVQGDYDGDGKTDLAVYRPGAAQWRVLQSRTDYATDFLLTEGLSGDVTVPADYDGDGRIDVAVYRPITGTWHIVLSSTDYSTRLVIPGGSDNDVPVPGDYDGDGRADLVVFRSGLWQIRLSHMNYTTGPRLSWGNRGDAALPQRP